MISAQKINKWFGQNHALRDISFEIQRGEIVGFLGHNGAGKTTLMRIMTHYFPMSSGKLFIDNVLSKKNYVRIREKIGYLPETPPLYPNMTVQEYLLFAAKMKNIKSKHLQAQVDRVLSKCGLENVARKIIGQLSKGYRQRVGIAQAIIHEPEILILDEPTAGLDPCQILEVRDLIQSLESKRTVLLSTHILSEIEQLAHRVLILRSGQVILDAGMRDVLSEQDSSKKIWLRVQGDQEQIELAIKETNGVKLSDVQREGDTILCRIDVNQTLRHYNELIDRIRQYNGEILELKSSARTLEDIYLEVNQ